MRRHILFTLLVLFPLSNGAQQLTPISGKVLDETKLEVIGASVINQNTQDATYTDIDGSFTITASVGDTLKVIYIGYDDYTHVVANNETLLKITLSQGSEILDEVVVSVGYQKVEQKKFTGVATRLKAEDVKVAGVPDPSRFLEGKDAGVVVDNVSGTFGASPRIRIRGNTSLNGNNNPIWVVDGVILEDNVELKPEDLASGDIATLVGSSIAGINPDDIKTFSILKDASATALYGARAKNGVIVITTRGGRKGDLKISYNSSLAIKVPPSIRSINVLDSQEEISIYNELVTKNILGLTQSQRAENYGVVGKYFIDRATNPKLAVGKHGGLAPSYFKRYQLANTDWFDELFKDFSIQHVHSISISGGTDKAIYFFSISSLNDEGQTIGDKVARYTARLNTKFNFTEHLSIGMSLNGSYRDQQAPGTNNRTLNPINGTYTRTFDINPYSYALNSSRSMVARNTDGSLAYFRRNYADFNIIHELNNNFINIDVTDYSFQTDLNYKIMEGLSMTSTFNYRNAITRREHQIRDRSNQAEAYRADNAQVANSNPYLFRDRNKPNVQPYSVLPEGGINLYNQDVLNYLYWRNSFSWDYDFDQKNEISMLGGGEIKYTNRESRYYNGIGIGYENGYLVNTSSDAIRQQLENKNQYFKISEFRDRFIGFFLNAGYTYDSKYTVNGTLRYDGSNLQGTNSDTRYLTNYNISGSWDVTKEDFFDIDWISKLKVKATYGLSGGRGPLTSANLTLRGDVTLRPEDVESKIVISNLQNKDLTFEKLNEFSTGIEFGFLNGRINGEIGYYDRLSYDLIGRVRTNAVGGESLKYGNYADLEVRGAEFSISTTNIKSEDFTWTTSFNIGYNTEEVTTLKTFPNYASLVSGNGSPFLGRETSALYSVRFAGLNKYGIPTFYGANNEIVTNLNLQSTTDIDKILKYEGPTQPRGAGGLNNTFTYQDFSLSANISFKFDYKIRLQSRFAPGYTDSQALPQELKNRWLLPGDEKRTSIPAILDVRTRTNILGGNNAYSLYNVSDQRTADGTYARLSNVTIGYNVPKDFIQDWGLQSAKVKLQADNMLLLYSDSKLNGQDPEFFNAGGAALPLTRTVTISLNLVF